MERLLIYFDESDPRNRGWAYSLETPDSIESDPLPHRRRAVSLATLARSVRREFRGSRPVVRAQIRRLTAELRRREHDGAYEASI